jgi:hypothetical protein
MSSWRKGGFSRAMPRPRRYPEELLDRGVRLVFESDRPIAHVAVDPGIHAERCESMCARPRGMFAALGAAGVAWEAPSANHRSLA